MHHGLYLLGAVVFLAVSLQPGAANWRGGSYRRKSNSVAYRVRHLEETVKQLLEEKEKISQRLDVTQELVKEVAERECQTDESSFQTPIDTVIYIPFETPFDRPPKVTVSVRGMSLFVIKYCEISVASVDAKGFSLNVNGGGIDVDVYFSWIACPSGTTDWPWSG